MISRFGFLIWICILVIMPFTSSIKVIAQEKSWQPKLDPDELVYSNLQKALANADSVKYLRLSRKKLKEFPKEIFQFKNLVLLDLSRNKIKVVPLEIDQLKSLQILNLSRNKINLLPASIGNLDSIIHINLNQNLIEILPPEIGNLKNLEVLELWSNELSGIPEEIKQATKLTRLELRGILFNQDQQNHIYGLLPNTKIYFSPACACKP
jgi:Leucine-rich repeat (LRR) protein